MNADARQSSEAATGHSRMMIAGVQMPVPLHGSNVAAMIAQVERAMALFPSIEMILFSELATHGPLIPNAAPDPAADEQIFCELAARHKIWLIPGSSFMRRDNAVYNQACVIDPQGAVIGRYDKLFPFLPLEDGVAGGKDLMVFDVPGKGRFGLSICYDIWFPETTRALTNLGVEVLLHPVLTGTTDRKVELSIARATAALFQCYVIDVNGLDAGGVGLSTVIDPTGVELHRAGQTPELFPVSIDLSLVRDVRRNGANGLGQVLKSFRDRTMSFPDYAAGMNAPYLDTLGPLQTVRR